MERVCKLHVYSVNMEQGSKICTEMATFSLSVCPIRCVFLCCFSISHPLLPALTDRICSKSGHAYFCLCVLILGSTTSSSTLQNEAELGDDDVFTVSHFCLSNTKHLPSKPQPFVKLFVCALSKPGSLYHCNINFYILTHIVHFPPAVFPVFFLSGTVRSISEKVLVVFLTHRGCSRKDGPFFQKWSDGNGTLARFPVVFVFALFLFRARFSVPILVPVMVDKEQQAGSGG